MRVAFISLTGNIKKFVQDGLNHNNYLEFDYFNPQVSAKEDYILIVPSYDDETTDVISKFIEYDNNLNHLVGVVGSGNMNFDEEYCFSAIKIANKYNKPLLMKFEFSGTTEDVEKFKKEVENIEITRTK